MKKFLFALAALLCISSASFAQVKKSKPAPAAKVTAPAARPAPGQLKKDGTPDMRYKANKEAVKPVGPLKKDGTPDMRYKVNKEAAKPTGPLKKDGTPDMRYKANKPAPKKKG